MYMYKNSPFRVKYYKNNLNLETNLTSPITVTIIIVYVTLIFFLVLKVRVELKTCLKSG